jgi:hypothetical protein
MEMLEETPQNPNYLKNTLTSGDVIKISAMCRKMKIKYDVASLLRKYHANMDFAKRLPNDMFSQSLIPGDVPCRLTAKRARTNGSCFFNSLSSILAENENMSEQLRILIVIELFENAEWYCDPKCITDALNIDEKKGLSENTLFLMTTSCDGIKPGCDRKSMIKNVAIKTCYLSEWISLVHFLAAASVIQQPLFSVYLQRCHRLGPTHCLYHHLISPRTMTGHDEREVPTIYIMWSRIAAFTYNFAPNHFVPLFPRSELQEIDNYEEEFPPLANEREVKSPKAKRYILFHECKNG